MFRRDQHRSQRDVKIRPHIYFPEYQYSFYFDNTVVLKKPLDEFLNFIIESCSLDLNDGFVCAPWHSFRKNILEDKREQFLKVNEKLVSLFVSDRDESLREKGIGDMSIGKYVKKYVKKFYYRLKILDAVFEENNKLDFNYFLKKIGIFGGQCNTNISEDLKNLYYDISIENNNK